MQLKRSLTKREGGRRKRSKAALSLPARLPPAALSLLGLPLFVVRGTDPHSSEMPGGDRAGGAALGPWPTLLSLASHSGWWEGWVFSTLEGSSLHPCHTDPEPRATTDSLTPTLLCFQGFRHFVDWVRGGSSEHTVSHGVASGLSFGSGFILLTLGGEDENVGQGQQQS